MNFIIYSLCYEKKIFIHYLLIFYKFNMSEANTITDYNTLIQEEINLICHKHKSVDGLVSIMEDMELNIIVIIIIHILDPG